MLPAPLESVAVPRLVVPSKNVTVPVGVTPPTEATVVVRVSAEPSGDGFTEELTAAVVFDCNCTVLELVVA